jgi:hypothetical protein
MKIGILSMQKIHNYGSFLQAFSLKKILEEKGHDVYFIDIKIGKKIVVDISRPSIYKYINKFDKFFIKRIQHYLMAKKMDKMYIEYQEKYLETTKSLRENESFDLAIIGSDEVFNCTISSPWGFSNQLFGKIENANRVVSYAASCGSTNYKKVCNYGIESEIYSAISNLANISVRDKNTKEFVKAISGRESSMNLDPVFIYDYNLYIPNKLNRKKYILIYAYSNRIKNEDEIAAIKMFAKMKGLDIVSVGQYQKWCPINLIANPFELLEYVKKSEYVITDTFHGTVFAIKYNKKFCSIIRKSNYIKLYDLLQKFNLEKQLLSGSISLSKILDTDIDYDKINNIISKEKKRSNEYIENCLDLAR